MKIYLSLLFVGFRPGTPQKWQGIRMLPAMSEPIPKIEAFAARIAPSPPDDPPGVRV